VEISRFRQGKRHGTCLLLQNNGNKEFVTYNQDKVTLWVEVLVDGTTITHNYNQEGKELLEQKRITNVKKPLI
jgi:hypothetical protein